MTEQYFKKDSSFGHIYKVTKNCMTEMQSVKFYDCAADTFKEFSLHEKAIAHDPDATSDEIALFKRAEHFHSKGRKLNEIKQGDLIARDNDFFLVTDIRDDGMLYDRAGLCGYNDYEDITIYLTREELEASAQGS